LAVKICDVDVSLTRGTYRRVVHSSLQGSFVAPDKPVTSTGPEETAGIDNCVTNVPDAAAKYNNARKNRNMYFKD